MFFTAVNPMDDDQSMEETRCDLAKPRIAPYKNTWTPHQNTVYWCNLKLAQKRGLQFYQTRHTQSFSTNHAVCMKIKEELYHKVCSTPRLPRVLLKADSHSGQQDHRDQDVRTSCDEPSESKSYGKPGTTPLATEFLAYHFRPLNSRIQHVKTRSRSCSRSSRTTSTRNPSFRT